MLTFQVLLPETIRPLVEARIKSGGFKDAADYLCHLVCEDNVGALLPTLEDELLERLRADPRPPGDLDVELARETGERRFHELRDDVLRGVEQADRGEVEVLDMDAIIREGQRRMSVAQVAQKAVG